MDSAIFFIALGMSLFLSRMKVNKPTKNLTKTGCKILIHGGAGVIDKKSVDSGIYMQALQAIILKAGQFANDDSKLAIDVAEYAVTLLENCELFNAGKGSVFTCNEDIEMEASIMDGRTLSYGAASLIKTVKNPIMFARKVMTKTVHQYIVGSDNIDKLARTWGLEMEDQDYFKTPHRFQKFQQGRKLGGVYQDHASADASPLTSSSACKKGTVGCVVMKNGDVAAATSTGGMSNKMSGRVGDSPCIGCGTYADNHTAAVSCTGFGELFMQRVVAYDVCARMRYGAMDLEKAVHGTIFEDLPMDSGGLIAVTSEGEISMAFNSPGMFRGYCDLDTLHGEVGIWQDMTTFSVDLNITK